MEDKYYMIPSGIWTAIADLNIDVYQNTGTVLPLERKDGKLDFKDPTLWRSRPHEDGTFQ